MATTIRPITSSAPPATANRTAKAAPASVVDTLTPRELDVLARMAEVWSNAATAQRLFLSERTVETHTGSIFAKLRLTESADENRRVRAILTYLESRSA